MLLICLATTSSLRAEPAAFRMPQIGMAERPTQTSIFAPDLFSDQVVFITGGGTGMGLELSRGLVSLGANVIIGSRDPQHHAEFLEFAEQASGTGTAVPLDVTSAGSVRAALDTTLEKFGRVDALVNNAAGNFIMPTEKMREQAWRSVISIALDGTFLCSREFGKQMLKVRSDARKRSCACQSAIASAIQLSGSHAKAPDGANPRPLMGLSTHVARAGCPCALSKATGRSYPSSPRTRGRACQVPPLTLPPYLASLLDSTPTCHRKPRASPFHQFRTFPAS